MPSKDNKETNSDYYHPAEVEDLVAAINHNLQLKSRPRCGHHKQRQRVAPYTIPPAVKRTLCNWASNNRSSNLNNSADGTTYCCKYCCSNVKSPMDRRTDDDSPYDMLQDLIREGGLIKEAVKRLQLGLNCTKPRKTDFYDLDDATSPRV